MFNSILVALNRGDASSHALGAAVDLARAARAKIVALFVVEHHLVAGEAIPEISEENIFRSFAHEEGEQELRYAEDLFHESGVEGYTLMVDASGEPVSDVICRAVWSASPDLLVMERHDPTALERIFGGEADKVLRNTKVPVLLVSDNTHE